MRITLVHLGRFMTGKLLPNFLSDARVCQCGIEAVSETVERQPTHSTPLATLFSGIYHTWRDVGSSHDPGK
jgi:hypothetical protein